MCQKCRNANMYNKIPIAANQILSQHIFIIKILPFRGFQNEQIELKRSTLFYSFASDRCVQISLFISVINQRFGRTIEAACANVFTVYPQKGFMFIVILVGNSQVIYCQNSYFVFAVHMVLFRNNYNKWVSPNSTHFL